MPKNPEWATCNQLADELNVHMKTIRRMATTGELPEGSYIKVGTKYRFHTERVMEHLYAATRA